LKNLQDKAFELCLAIYRMIKYFPEREVLINQIKGLANELTANILILDKAEKSVPAEIVPQAERLIVFLRIAGTQGWLNPINFDFLISGYQKLQNDLLVWENMDLRVKKSVNEISIETHRGLDSRWSLPRSDLRGGNDKSGRRNDEHISETTRKKMVVAKIPRKDVRITNKREINQRQKKILDFLNKRKEAKMSDLQGIFKNEVTERTLRNDLQGLAGQKMIRAEGEFKTRKYYIK